MSINFQTMPWQETLVMIRHWMSVPENGYLGSSYGGRTLLASCISNTPQPDAIAKVIAKLKEDVTSMSNESIILSWSPINSYPKVLKIAVGDFSADIQVL